MIQRHPRDSKGPRPAPISPGSIQHSSTHGSRSRLASGQGSSLSEPPAGARPRDVIVRFHYYESKEALTLATCNKSQLMYKGAKLQIFSDLSPITLAKRRNLRPITSHLQRHQVPYYWGFPFCLTVSKDVPNIVSEIFKREKLF